MSIARCTGKVSARAFPLPLKSIFASHYFLDSFTHNLIIHHEENRSYDDENSFKYSELNVKLSLNSCKATLRVVCKVEVAHFFYQNVCVDSDFSNLGR